METSEVLVSIVVATILLIVAFLAGATRTEENPAPTLRKGATEMKNEVEPTAEEPVPVEEEIDEFSFEPAEALNEVPMPDETAQAMVESIEVIELPDEEDATPSGRLASMRDEITSDRPSSEGRQDRMRKFFGKE